MFYKKQIDAFKKATLFDGTAKETAASYLTSLIRQSVSDAIFEMIWPRNVAISLR